MTVAPEETDTAAMCAYHHTQTEDWSSQCISIAAQIWRSNAGLPASDSRPGALRAMLGLSLKYYQISANAKDPQSLSNYSPEKSHT